MTAEAIQSPRRETREAFWTLAVGAPAAFAVLRMWVESGGELQITLLLVSHVGPLELGASLFATTTQLLTMIMIALLTVGGILRSCAAGAPPDSPLRTFPSFAARTMGAAPPWFVAMTFILAALTWKILYLPLLVPAAIAVSQRPPWRMHDRWQVSLGFCLLGLAGYFWLVGAAIVEAWGGGEFSVAWLLALPPLLSFGVVGALPGWFARTFAVLSQLAIVSLAVLAVYTAMQTPILPTVVAEVRPDGRTYSEYLRAHIINVDDVYVVLLQEHGGVRYLPTEDVKSTVLCGTPYELPAYGTRVRDYHVEDSFPSAIGRHVRPRIDIDPLCRGVVPNPDSEVDSR